MGFLTPLALNLSMLIVWEWFIALRWDLILVVVFLIASRSARRTNERDEML